MSVREGLGSLIRSAGLWVETFASAQKFLDSPRSDVAELSGIGCSPAGPERARSTKTHGAKPILRFLLFLLRAMAMFQHRYEP